MKNTGYLLLFFCLFSGSIPSMAQRPQFPMQVVYEIICIPDSTKMDQTHHEMAELLISDSQAVFRALDKSIEAKAHYEAMRSGIIPGPQQGTIFDFEIVQEGADILYLGPIERRINKVQYAFGYKDDMRNFEWVLHDETMEILGYTCQQATLNHAGRKWIAWFCPDIPVHYGPFIFGNLGGLILRMEDSSGEWVFNAQGINSDPKRISYFMLAFDEHAQIELFDRNSYYHKKKDYFLTRVDRAMARGFIYPNREAEERAKAMALSQYNRNSNWIEFSDEQIKSK